MWIVETTDTFDEWLGALDAADRTNVLALLLVLQEKGPTLSRPYADTVYGSRYSNMKELRIQSKGRLYQSIFCIRPREKGDCALRWR